MHHGLRGLAVLCLLIGWSAGLAWAEGEGAAAIEAAVLAADDARVQATLSRDRAGLEDVLSEQLGYGHSNGRIETRAAFIDALASGRLAYTRVEYRERSVTSLSSDVALMRGRVGMDARLGDQTAVLDLAFLAVWHCESGTWRLVAWQSCRVPPTGGG